MDIPINQEHVAWLTRCPSEDINFKCHLVKSNAAELAAALRDDRLTKTARLKIERRLRKLQRATRAVQEKK